MVPLPSSLFSSSALPLFRSSRRRHHRSPSPLRLPPFSPFTSSILTPSPGPTSRLPFRSAPLPPVPLPCSRFPTGVCEKSTPPEKKKKEKKEKKTRWTIVFEAPNQGLESSFCCWTAGQGLAQKECFFSDAGSSHVAPSSLGPLELRLAVFSQGLL